MSSQAKRPPELVDHGAEHALLGAALLDYNVFLAFDVTPDDFSDARWRTLWAAGQDLAREGTQADPVTLGDDVINVIGGAATIVNLINGCLSVARAGDYARIVKTKARQRRKLEVANLWARAAHASGEKAALLEARARELEAELLAEADDSTAGWQIYTLADAYAPRDPLTYVVADLFSLPSLSIVYGAPGCLKSMLLADMALCVAAGIPWLEALPDSDENTARLTVQVPVLWLDFDNGKRRTDERIQALGRARSLEPEATPFSYVCMPSPWLDGSSSSSMDGLIKRVNIMSVGLVVVDNLGVVSGDADENSAEMVHVLANFRRLAEEAGAAVVIIHHQRKATGFKSRAGEALRGHSSIEAALDLALLVEREEHADEVVVKSTKTRGVDVLPFGALFTYEHKAGTTELARARFYGVRVEDKSSDAAIQRAVLEAVEESPLLYKEELISAVQETLKDVGRNRIRNTIDRLAYIGKLNVTKGGRTGRAKCYTLA